MQKKIVTRTSGHDKHVTVLLVFYIGVVWFIEETHEGERQSTLRVKDFEVKIVKRNVSQLSFTATWTAVVFYLHAQYKL